jgi:hypothetical protein
MLTIPEFVICGLAVLRNVIDNAVSDRPHTSLQERVEMFGVRGSI